MLELQLFKLEDENKYGFEGIKSNGKKVNGEIEGNSELLTDLINLIENQKNKEEEKEEVLQNLLKNESKESIQDLKPIIPEFRPNQEYIKGDLVKVGDEVYEAKKKHKSEAKPSEDTANWKKA